MNYSWWRIIGDWTIQYIGYHNPLPESLFSNQYNGITAASTLRKLGRFAHKRSLQSWLMVSDVHVLYSKFDTEKIVMISSPRETPLTKLHYLAMFLHFQLVPL